MLLHGDDKEDRKVTKNLCDAHDNLRHDYFRGMLGLDKNKARDEASGWVLLANVTWLRHADHGYLAITGPNWLSKNCVAMCESAGLPPGALSLGAAPRAVPPRRPVERVPARTCRPALASHALSQAASTYTNDL